ncbi:hypothetical protein GDO86_003968 [Hymenochirus boettgeri]|uniref:TTF-type domain-containing protein n=1 Tax=Hymenochirus boettgeri TaxID=247094 RepID=A0A8T2K6F3_9PIPI|nr:hypothetical protein GDO86_003968 [Hymenochirus boettgeri]
MATFNDPSDRSADITQEEPCEVVPPAVSKGQSNTKSMDIQFTSDPVDWNTHCEKLKDHIALYGIKQNKDADFSLSVRHYADRARCMSDKLFASVHRNGEVIPRPWLVYSIKLKMIFCAACRLYGGIGMLANEGFNDWKNASVRLMEHEDSKQHKDCYLQMQSRAKMHGRIDHHLIQRQNEEIKYWREVLKRVVTVVKFLSTRGLPFRGSNEKFGSLTNGNYLMMLEAISAHDPFLEEHIKKYGTVGSGTASYLSKTVCYEFIDILSSKVLDAIIKEIKEAKYYSISVNSTPDIAHMDQLSFIIRYVNKDGVPKERFLKFIPNVGHKSENLCNVVLETLKSFQIDIMDCRGQSYDNASNMSGQYSGLQARIKQINPLAVFIPCAAHSLNLVGTCAVDCCRDAVSFFRIVQQLYNFFSGTPARWEVLVSHMQSGATVLKSLSTTRWSARSDACLSLRKSWKEIIGALDEIADDSLQKSDVRAEAHGIRLSLQTLETAILTVFWSYILERFNATSRRLQSTDIEVSSVVRLYGGLLTLLQETRDGYDRFEKEAKDMSGLEEYKGATERERKIKLPFDVSHKGQVIQTPKDKFRVNTFLVMLDRLTSELQKRAEAYQQLSEQFSFFEKIANLDIYTVITYATNLCKVYANDLQDNLSDECLHLSSYLKSTGMVHFTIPHLLQIIVTDSLKVIYPNIHVALRIFLCTMATNCSAERSFSCLRRLKDYLRSSLTEERLNSFALLSTEPQLVMELPYDDIIDEFAKRKVRSRRL